MASLHACFIIVTIVANKGSECSTIWLQHGRYLTRLLGMSTYKRNMATRLSFLQWVLTEYLFIKDLYVGASEDDIPSQSCRSSIEQDLQVDPLTL